MKFHNLKVGETYYAVTERRLEKGKTTLDVTPVTVTEIHPKLDAVLASWRGREERWYFDGVYCRWRFTKPTLVPKGDGTYRCATKQELKLMKES